MPEAEWSRQLAEKHLRGKRVKAVRFVDDRIVFDGVLPAAFAKQLQGRRVEETCRWGKQLWFQMDEAPQPMFHLGMTGTLRVQGAKALQYVNAKKNDPDAEKWPPKFWKVELEMEDGTRFAFTDARRFGRIKLLAEPRLEPPVSEMGFDPLHEMPSLEIFREGLRKRSCDVKALLLDQSFAAGVGNWIADEVLYQAKIHPQERVNTLQPDAIAAMHEKMSFVIRTACRLICADKDFPKTWLFHYRWAKKSGADAAGAAVDGHGRPIQFVTSGGRTSAFVPEVQLLSSSKAKAKPKPNSTVPRAPCKALPMPPPKLTAFKKPLGMKRPASASASPRAKRPRASSRGPV